MPSSSSDGAHPTSPTITTDATFEEIFMGRRALHSPRHGARDGRRAGQARVRGLRARGVARRATTDQATRQRGDGGDGARAATLLAPVTSGE